MIPLCDNYSDAVLRVSEISAESLSDLALKLDFFLETVEVDPDTPLELDNLRNIANCLLRAIVSDSKRIGGVS